MGRKNTEAQKKAKEEYEKKNELIRFYAPKGFKEKALKKAETKGFNRLGHYIVDLIEKD